MCPKFYKFSEKDYLEDFFSSERFFNDLPQYSFQILEDAAFYLKTREKEEKLKQKRIKHKKKELLMELLFYN